MSANQQNPYVGAQFGIQNQGIATQHYQGLPRAGEACDLEMDADLKRVMEFMQSNMPASKLVGVAQALFNVAPVVWGRYEREEVRALTFLPPPIGRV